MISRVFSAVGVGAALLLAGCGGFEGGTVVAQSAVERPGQSTFHFLAVATDADVLAIYPHAAMDQGITGGATVQCRFTETGGFDACVTLSESPPGWGFGDGARVVMARYRWNPAAYPEMVGRQGRQKVVFRLP